MSEQPRSVTDKDFLYHVFHLISQPMTTLQCSLELALIGEAGPEELRSSIESALENAERLRQRLLLVRELAEASDAADLSRPVELEEVLLEVLEQLQPLLESIGQMSSVSLCKVLVAGDRRQLLRAFLYLFESLLGHSAPAGAATAVVVVSAGNCALVRVTGVPPEVLSGERIKIRPEIEIARRTFEAVGGSLSLMAMPDGTSSCEVVLRTFDEGTQAGDCSADTIDTLELFS